MSVDTLLGEFDANRDGLDTVEAATRLKTFGPNSENIGKWVSTVHAVARRLLEPLSLILLAAGVVSAATGDAIGGSIIVVILAFSVLLDTYQEGRAVNAAETLRRSVAVSANVRRDGVFRGIPIDTVVPGDLIRVQAGDIIPADALILECAAFTANEAALTGEPYPVDKKPGIVTGATAAVATNALFRSAVAQTGTATALVVGTGRNTLFGSAAAALVTAQPPSPFERDQEPLRRRELHPCFAFGTALEKGNRHALPAFVIRLMRFTLKAPVIDSAIDIDGAAAVLGF